MRWPNRRTRYERTGSGISLVDGLRTRIENWRGQRALLNLDRELASWRPMSIQPLVADTRCGEPFGVVAPDGRFLTEPILRYSIFVSRLELLLGQRLSEAPVIVEIGGGTGGLARLLKLWRPKSRIVLVDFPERLLAQAYYLSDAFPQASFAVCHDGDRTSASSADVTFVPTWGLDRFTRPVDLFVNTHSFKEMMTTQVAHYLERINALCSGWVYAVNREQKRIGDEVVEHPRKQLLSMGWSAVYEGRQPLQPIVIEGLYTRQKPVPS